MEQYIQFKNILWIWFSYQSLIAFLKPFTNILQSFLLGFHKLLYDKLGCSSECRLFCKNHEKLIFSRENCLHFVLLILRQIVKISVFLGGIFPCFVKSCKMLNAKSCFFCLYLPLHVLRLFLHGVFSLFWPLAQHEKPCVPGFFTAFHSAPLLVQSLDLVAKYSVDSLIAKVNQRLSHQKNKFNNLPTPPNFRFEKSKSVGENLEQKKTRKPVPPKNRKQRLSGLKERQTRAGINYTPKRIATCTVYSSRNNTLLTLMGAGGKIFKKGWASAGSLGFKNSRKSTTYASTAAAKSLAQIAKQRGVRALYLKLHGVGRAKSAVVRTLQLSRLKVLAIRENTPAVHNGCRPPKKRRI